MIMGTAPDMSPERAGGRTVDKRADIWAFGVVLYELVTGRRPFQGEDVTDLFASVMKDKPDLSCVPAQVRGLLESCLEKDPTKRLRDIGDIRFLLADPSAPVSSRTSRLERLLWIAAAGGMTAGRGVSGGAAWHCPAAGGG